MRRTTTLAIAGFTAGALALSACSGPDQAATTGGGTGGTPAKGGTVDVLQTSDFSYLDPARGFDGGVNAFYRLVYRQLVTKAAGDAENPNAMIPDLAERLGTPSADGLSGPYEL